MCHLKAIENGCDTIDTAISSMAGGTSHPPTESMVAALRGTEYDTGLDLEAIQEVGMYFYQVRKHYHQFESDFTGIDTRVQVNQVPGGMISNLANQLKEQNALERMSAVLEEIPRVRKDLGYPPLVTPTSQIVGTQAVLNVLTDKRYQTITNEVKLYLQGRYGRSPAPVNPTLQQQAIGNEELVDCRPADLLKPELERLTRDIGTPGAVRGGRADLRHVPGDRPRLPGAPGRRHPPARAPGAAAQRPVRDGTAPTEFNIAVHGETYHVKVTGAGHKRPGGSAFLSGHRRGAGRGRASRPWTSWS